MSKQYLKNLGISQSFLKNVLKNDTKKKDTTFLRRGSLLDTLVTSPELFDEHYKVVKTPATSDTVASIFDSLIRDSIEFEDRESVLKVCLSLDYFAGKDRAYNELVKAKEYYDTMKEIVGFIPISKDEYEGSKVIANNCRKWLDFNPNNTQIDLYGDLTDTKGNKYLCKGLLDRYDDSTLTDFKTTSLPLRDFGKACRDFRYDFQMAFYYDLLQENHFPVLKVDWLVYSYADKKIALIEMDMKDLHIGREGHDFKKWVKGYRQALDIYKYCTDNKLKDWDDEYHRKGGKFLQEIW